MLSEYNRRTLNPIQAKAFFYYARAFELANKLEDIRTYEMFVSIKTNQIIQYIAVKLQNCMLKAQ
jgi:hypothetical protein